MASRSLTNVYLWEMTCRREKGCCYEKRTTGKRPKSEDWEALLLLFIVTSGRACLIFLLSRSAKPSVRLDVKTESSSNFHQAVVQFGNDSKMAIKAIALYRSETFGNEEYCRQNANIGRVH